MQTKVVQQKIASVKNIKKITKAMEMISVSKMRRSVARALASREYARYALELLVNLHKNRNIEHPFLTPREKGKTLMIIFASSKGLCGGYNVNVQKAVVKELEEIDNEVDVITIGKQADRIAGRLGLKIVASLPEFADNFDVEKVREVFAILNERFNVENSEYKNVSVAYTRFVNSAEYDARVRELVPLSPKMVRKVVEEGEEGREEERFELDSLGLYLFEPSEREVLDTIVPSLIKTLFFQIALESLASEHSSRMTAMKNATDNAGEMLGDLQLEFNRARQAGITQEIGEIVSGAEALS